MAGSLYFLLTFLPSLPALGETPPIDLETIAKSIAEGDGQCALALFNAVVLEKHVTALVARKIVGRETWPFDPQAELAGVVSDHLLRVCEQALPEPREEEWTAQLWEEYFTYVKTVGARNGSPLLADWASWEQSLRRKLADRRAGASEHPFHDDWDHSSLIAAWAHTKDPFEGERVLDLGRLRFLEERSIRYSFSLDEFTAYLLKLRLLHRYAILDRQKGVKILEEVSNP